MLSHLQLSEGNSHPCFIDKLKFRQVTLLFTHLFRDPVLVKLSLTPKPSFFQHTKLPPA